MRPLFLFLLPLGACVDSSVHKQSGEVGSDTADPQQPSTDTGADTGADTGTPDGPVSARLSTPDGTVLDPKLSGEPTLGLEIFTESTECDAYVLIDNGVGQRIELAGRSHSWDGADDEGLFFEPGPARAQATLDCGEGPAVHDTQSLHIVRLGIQSIDLSSPDGSTVDLAFHKTGLLGGSVSPIGERPEYRLTAGVGAAAGAVDDDVGQPRTAPRWTDPDSPPWAHTEPIAHNIPAGFIAGGSVQAVLTLGAQAVSESRHIAVDAFGPRPDDVPPLRLVGSDLELSPGSTLTLPLEAASSTMGKEVRALSWSFESLDSEGSPTPIPGVIQTEHTIYTLAGPPALLDGTDVGAAPPIPWIGVLEDTAVALNGVEAAPGPVLDALRDYLFEHPYIIYNPGDSAYTSFTGAYIYWTSITADLTGFLDRSGGLDLYCHSMSCLLSALAGNVGVEAEQIVLGVSFTTNQTRAAGGTTWRRWSFNSHSVVTPDGGLTIWDSSIALDGDDDPYSEPIEEVMPRGMEGEEYLWRLSYDDIGIVNSGLCYIR
jgi:hypothetical protein